MASQFILLLCFMMTASVAAAEVSATIIASISICGFLTSFVLLGTVRFFFRGGAAELHGAKVSRTN
jgi:hypothetical protein